MTWRERSGLWSRLLTFRTKEADWQSFDWKLLSAGLVLTWLAGVGRYWDDPRAELLQNLGLGSVTYVFVLALLLWIILKPLDTDRFTYFHILTFVCLTSPPALLYAIPVEMWMSLEDANMVNLIFLGLVALWRLALYTFYVIRFGSLGWLGTIACVATPLAVILLTLTALNLNDVIVNVMGGIREADKSSQDAAYMVTMIAAYLSVPVSIVAGLIWLTLCGIALRDRGEK